MTVYFENNTTESFPFDEKDLLTKVISQTMEILDCPYEVSVVGEDEIRRLNREFRDIDSVTDVLSFPMNEFDSEGVFAGETFESSLETDPDTDELILGDVILCAEKVKAQAEEYGHSEEREFAFLVVHSLLHLCGYDHMEDEDRLRMEDRQRQIMDQLKIYRE